MIARGGPRTRIVRALSCAALVAACSGLAACDGREAASRWTVTTTTGLRIVSSDVGDGTHVGNGTIRVDFDRDIDPSSVGTRSVRIERADGRRVRRVRIWARGSTVFLSPAPGRPLPADTDLDVRLEGGGSPRAIRALDGSRLADTERLGFRVLTRRRADLEGPRLLFSEPATGTAEAAPGSHIQLAFDEPLSRDPVRTGDAVTVRVNGVESPTRMRLSPDLTRLVVRPRRHLPPGAVVDVLVQPSLIDVVGNPAAPAAVRFRTRATRLRELAEDFVTTDMQDGAGTTGGWAAPEAPGVLVARAGRIRWSPSETSGWALEMPAAAETRFQVLYPWSDVEGGVASALRLYVNGAEEGEELPGATVEIGPSSLVRLDPTFDANRGAADLKLVAVSGEPAVVEADDEGATYVDVTFDVPAMVRSASGTLVEVRLELPPGVRLAATEDPGALALVDVPGARGLLPAVELLVGGGPPQARSVWWDSGLARPAWHAAIVEGAIAGRDDAVVEFQTAAATEDGLPDLDRASDWGPRLDQQPALRFVRFRVRFTRLGARGDEPRIDRIVLPYLE